jgi:hypothetical protein
LEDASELRIIERAGGLRLHPAGEPLKSVVVQRHRRVRHKAEQHSGSRQIERLARADELQRHDSRGAPGGIVSVLSSDEPLENAELGVVGAAFVSRGEFLRERDDLGSASMRIDRLHDLSLP